MITNYGCGYMTSPKEAAAIRHQQWIAQHEKVREIPREAYTFYLKGLIRESAFQEVKRSKRQRLAVARALLRKIVPSDLSKHLTSFIYPTRKAFQEKWTQYHTRMSARAIEIGYQRVIGQLSIARLYNHVDPHQIEDRQAYHAALRYQQRFCQLKAKLGNNLFITS